MLPSFVAFLSRYISISFQTEAYKSAFLVRFVVSVMLHICLWRVPWLHGFGTEVPGM